MNNRSSRLPESSYPGRLPTQEDLATCLIGDRPSSRRRLQVLNRRALRGQPIDRELAELRAAIRKSRNLVEQRRAKVPTIEYPLELPVSERCDEVATLIRNHQVVVLRGETGSGKSTQLPKICLDLGGDRRADRPCPQPRRIAARSLTSRLSQELGTEPGTLVGYQVRFHDRTEPEISIKLMTDGILLAEIRQGWFLNQYDTLIIDEAHERSLNIDFLLGYLKGLLPRRPDLKLIVTSATIDPQRFAEHFAGAAGPAPIIEISGRTYLVAVRYRPPGDEHVSERDDAMQPAIAPGHPEAGARVPGPRHPPRDLGD